MPPRIRYQPAADDEGSSSGDPSVPPEQGAAFFTPATGSGSTYTTAGGTLTVDPWDTWSTSWSIGTGNVTYTSTPQPRLPWEQRPDETDEQYTARRAREREEVARRDQERWRARREAAEQREREHQARLARMETAKARAEELLRLTLLPDELAEYDRTKRIIITGSDGRRYEITDGVVNNVHLIANNPSDGYRGWAASMCAHPNMSPGYNETTGQWESDEAPDGLPHRDAHVGQILCLRYDAPSFWRRANVDWHDWSVRTESLREWCSRHKFRGDDSEVDRDGLSAEARAAFPTYQRQPRDERGRFVARAA